MLTYRDPRDYLPFSDPPARTINPQLSPGVERLIAKAVNNDLTQRYQSAAATKRDVDAILLKRLAFRARLIAARWEHPGPSLDHLRDTPAHLMEAALGSAGPILR